MSSNRRKNVYQLGESSQNEFVGGFLEDANRRLEKDTYTEISLSDWSKIDKTIYQVNQLNTSRARLSGKVRYIFRQVLEFLEQLHIENGQVHEDITADNIILSIETNASLTIPDNYSLPNLCAVKIIGGTYRSVGKDFSSFKKDIKQVVNVLEELIKNENCDVNSWPEDFVDFKNLVNPLSTVSGAMRESWGLLYNHPMFWNAKRRANFIQNLRMEQYSHQDSSSSFYSNFRQCLGSIPKSVYSRWTGKIPQDSTFGVMLRNPIVQRSYNNTVLDLLIFSRDVYTHLPKLSGIFGGDGMKEEIDETLYVLSPLFLPSILVNSYNLDLVRQIAHLRGPTQERMEY